MFTASIQAKIEPKTKVIFTKLAKTKKKNISSYINQLIINEIQKNQRSETVKKLKKLLAENKLTPKEDKELAEFYGLED